MSAIAEELFGFSTQDELLASPATVGTTPVRVAPQNPNRAQLVFTNPDGVDVTLNTTSEIVADEGFVVPQSGGSAVFNVTEDGGLPGREWYAVVNSGSANLNVIGEVVEGGV